MDQTQTPDGKPIETQAQLAEFWRNVKILAGWLLRTACLWSAIVFFYNGNHAAAYFFGIMAVYFAVRYQYL